MTAPAATAPPAVGTARRPDIQGLRAIAVLVVVVYHAGLPLPGGFVGVDVFFVISGYVITAMLQREFASEGRIRFGRFYARRFQRLTPALALVVAVTMIASAFLLSPLGSQQTAAQTGLGAMLLAANFVIALTTGGYFDAPAEGNPLLNTWSLSVEEQFYLAFPAILLLGWVLARRWRPAALMIVSLIGVASFALAWWGSSGRAPDSLEVLTGFYSPFTRAWEFALGAVVALLGARLALASRGLSLLVAALGSAMLVASLFLIDGRTPFPGTWTLLPTLATVLLIIAGGSAVNVISRGLSTRPMVRIGDWSYSIYLWHWPLIVFAAVIWPHSTVALVLAAAVSLVPAVISYHFVEQPIRLLRGLNRPRFTALVIATVAPALLLAGGLWATANRGFLAPSVAEFQTQITTPSLASQLGCDTGLPLAELPEACRLNGTANGPPVWLLGDSNGAQFSNGIVAAGADLGRPTVLATMNGCPFIDVEIRQSAFSAEREQLCRDYVQGTIAQLAAEPPGVAVLASSDRIWRNRGFQIRGDDGFVKGGTREARELLTRELERTVRLIQDAGHSVVLVQVIPHFGNPASDTALYPWDPLACSTFDITSGDCNAVMPRAYSDDQQGASIEGLAQVGERTGALIASFRDDICPGADCVAVRDTLPLYRDASHLSVAASNSLAPQWIRVLEEARVG